MKKLPIGIQSFENLRKEDYSYVDKTAYIWQLASMGKFYFLSRPRRFGKSLLLSTFEAYFLGKRELFQGLKTEALEKKSTEPWNVYPVIHISFAAGNFSDPEELTKKLNTILRTNAEEFQVPSHLDDTFGDRFFQLIKDIHDKVDENVVILVDEYDKPLLDNISVNQELEDNNRNTLKGFFGALKDADPYIKFVFITGVTKFSKVSIFSDLNQLNDISLSDDFSAICGITEEEMTDNFSAEINDLAERKKVSAESCVDILKKNYDGYHFSAYSDGVYNPFSLFNCFFKHRIGMYWFETGTPTYLVRRLLSSDYTLQDLSEGVGEDESAMSNYRADDYDLIPLLYQSGYLTIKAFGEESQLYTLGFPNQEVEYGFEKFLVPYVLKGDSGKRLASPITVQARRLLR